MHSKQLGHGSSPVGAGTVIYTCPTGKRTIVKSVLIQNNSAATNRVILTLSYAAGGSIGWGLTLGASASATESLHYNCWIVMNAGDVLTAQGLTSSSINLVASGAELTV